MTKRYNYGKVICIFMGCVFAYVIILTLAGPEKLGHKFGVAHDSDLYDAAGDDAVAAVVRREEGRGHGADEYTEKEKAAPLQKEILA